jgi:hypothetical protein
MLSMTITHWEKMTIFQAYKMRYCNPHVLINLVRITRWKTCFCSKCKFRDAISPHLFWVWRIVRKRIILYHILRFIFCPCSLFRTWLFYLILDITNLSRYSLILQLLHYIFRLFKFQFRFIKLIQIRLRPFRRIRPRNIWVGLLELIIRFSSFFLAILQTYNFVWCWLSQHPIPRLCLRPLSRCLALASPL